ncbi:MAG TPA: 3-methyl-2-oxobutanoate hydroxymethyltransferase [Candidatus Acidoferrum sp.]|nr:3-methyl-2-oxobutanoate hydroxymethyltransferase [Candidatus Acidoferrum sp.]
MALTILDLQRFKADHQRFVMLTAYDYPTAAILDAAGIPVIFVGDTLGQVILGFETTVPVSMGDMLHHIQAVRRAVTKALLVGDLPFASYQVSIEEGIRNAGRLVQEGGVNVVKLEGPQVELARRLVACGIPVMGHLGYTPQSINTAGRARVQGRTAQAAEDLRRSALALEAAGACCLVLEAVPWELARTLTESLTIPTIGIGAGPFCDGQVLVITDLLGLGTSRLTRVPRFVKQYAHLDETIAAAVTQFRDEVAAGQFPDLAHSYE